MFEAAILFAAFVGDASWCQQHPAHFVHSHALQTTTVPIPRYGISLYLIEGSILELIVKARN